MVDVYLKNCFKEYEIVERDSLLQYEKENDFNTQ